MNQCVMTYGTKAWSVTIGLTDKLKELCYEGFHYVIESGIRKSVEEPRSELAS